MSDPTRNEAPSDGPGDAPGSGASGGQGSPPPRRLTRRTDDRVLGGVASGLAHHFGIDPVVARLIFVGLALYGGLGLIGYLVCWAVIPPDDAASAAPAADGAGESRGAGRVIGIVALVVAALMFLPGLFGVLPIPDAFAPPQGPFPAWPGPVMWPFRPSVLAAIVLIIAGVALYQAGRRRDDPAPGDTATADPPASPQGVHAARSQAPVPPSAEPSADSPQAPGQTLGGGHGPGDPPPSAEPRAAAPTPAPSAPPSSPLARLTLAAALLVTGVAALLDRATTLDLGLSDLLALALLTVGVGLLLGAWWGRARWLIAVGLALMPFALVAVLLPMPGWRDQGFEAAAGERFHRPTSVEDLRDSYSLAAGRLVLDLSELDLPQDEETEVAITVTTGQIEVVLPPDADAVLSGRTLVGAVRFPGRHAAGLVVTEDRVDTGDGDALLRLDLSARVGEISVRRSGEPSSSVPAHWSSATWTPSAVESD